MKLIICALFSSVALALAISAPAQNGTSSLDAAEVPKGFPSNVAELGKMVDRFRVDTTNDYYGKIDVKKWHLARMEFKVLEAAGEWIQPRLTSHHQWLIKHTLFQMKEYLVSPRDADAVQACSEGDMSEYCTYYNFELYASEVEGLAMDAAAWSNFYVSDDQDADIQEGINEQLASTKLSIDRLKAAPVELWGTEPRAEEVQKSLERSTEIIDSAMAAMQAKRL